MKWTQQELSHLVFLSNVVLGGKKKAAMEDMFQCLLYIVKSMEEVDLPDAVAEEMKRLIGAVEEMLRSENDRMQDIRSNFRQPGQRSPLGR